MKHKLKILCLLVLISIVGCSSGGEDVLIPPSNIDDPFGPDLLAVDDQYSTFRNQVLSVGNNNGVLANDFICCDGVEIRFPTVSNSGGTVAGRPDGSFTYTPPTGFIGTDSFAYELEDEIETTVGEVLIAVNERPVPDEAIVDSALGNDNTGNATTGAPFATIQAAVNAAGPNQRVLVRPGNGQAYLGAVTLRDGQILVGQGFEGIFPQGTVQVQMRGPINMADDCKVTGFRVEAQGTSAVVASAAADGEIVLCELSSTSDYALDLNGAVGTWFVDDNIVENSVGGLESALVGNDQLILSLLGNTFRNNDVSAVQLSAEGTSDLSIELNNNTMTSHQAGLAVNIESFDSAGVCLDLVSNDNDNTYRLNRNSGSFQVEQLAQLEQLNQGTVQELGTALESVADGFCGF